MPHLQPTVRPTNVANKWEHTAPFVYHDERSQIRYTIKPGAKTDGASIPRVLWSLVGSPMIDGRVFKAAAIHDQLYKSLGANGQLTRGECDRVFCCALVDHGVSIHRTALYYLGVILGGWVGWNRYARAPDQAAHESTLIDVEFAAKEPPS